MASVTSHFNNYENNHEPNADDAWKIQPEDLWQMVVDLLRLNPRTLPSKIEVPCYRRLKLRHLTAKGTATNYSLITMLI